MLPQKSDVQNIDDEYNNFILYREEQTEILDHLYKKLVRREKLSSDERQTLKHAAYFRNKHQETRLLREGIITPSDKRYKNKEHTDYIEFLKDATKNDKNIEKIIDGTYAKRITIISVVVLLGCVGEIIFLGQAIANALSIIVGIVDIPVLLGCMVSCIAIKDNQNNYNEQKSVYHDSGFDQYKKIDYHKDHHNAT